VVVKGMAQPKAGTQVSEAARITVKESSPFVSLGGEKLAGALDTGASTGGPAPISRAVAHAFPITPSALVAH